MLILNPLHTLSSDEPGMVRVHPHVYATDATAQIINQLPQEAREHAVFQLRKIGSMIERAAKAMAIEPPVLLLPHGEKGSKYAASRAYNSYLFDGDLFCVRHINPHRAAITIDPRFISGLGCLSPQGQLRPSLCHTDDEIYSVIAHEVGHAVNYNLQYMDVPKHERSDGISFFGFTLGAHDNMPIIEIIRRFNHSIEYQMDGRMLQAGATREGMLGSLIKMVIDLREQAFKDTPGDHAAKVKARTAASHYPLKAAKDTHPSLPDRDKAMRLHQTDPQAWAERLTADRQALLKIPDLGR